VDEKTLTTVGGVAKRFGVSTQTIRDWETKSGISPARDMTGGRRIYDQKDVRRLEVWRGDRDRLAGRSGSDEA